MYVLLSICVLYSLSRQIAILKREMDFMPFLIAMTPQCIFSATFCVPFSFLLVCLVLMLFVGFFALTTSTLTW